MSDEDKNLCFTSNVASSKDLSLLKSAVEQTSNIVLITDANLESPGPKIVYVNPAFEMITGYGVDEVIGKTPRILHGPKTSYELMKDLKETLLRGEEFHGSTTNYKKNGEEYDVEWHISPVRDEEGNITHFVSVQEDITLKKIRERMLKKYAEKLEEEVRTRTREVIQSEKMAAVGLLVAGVAHEINNPVSYIKANLEFIEEDLKELGQMKEGEKRDELLENMGKMLSSCRDGANRISQITTTLKRFSKPDGGGMTPDNINQGLEDTLLIVHNQLKNRITVHKELDKLPLVTCNIGQLNQVFLNLIINASQAMETGDIWIHTYQREGEVFIEIKDNGSGISEKALDTIFDAFYTTKDKGTGLGLSVSYKIIEMHGGRIEVESKIGEGSKFTVRIPKR
ncbi:MAG: ATP-binding protein [Candidatus Thermoplasmatota archaeon]|nr:ATP-binding protein [Candidatus Thermoplasmatota archaeon]